MNIKISKNHNFEFLNLPNEIQEKIYFILNPKERYMLALCSKFIHTNYYDKNRELSLYGLEIIINKLILNQDLTSQNNKRLYTLLFDHIFKRIKIINNKDIYEIIIINKLLNHFKDDIKLHMLYMIQDLEDNNIDKIILYSENDINLLLDNFNELFIEILAKKSPNIFKNLFYTNINLRKIFHKISNDFMFGVVRNRNYDLLDYIMSLNKDENEWLNFNVFIPYVSNLIFILSYKVEDIIKLNYYFNLNIEHKKKILDHSIEQLYMNTVIYIEKELKKELIDN
jgi:hypothetical protein